VAAVALWQTGLEVWWTAAWDRLGAQLADRPWLLPFGVLSWCVASRLIYEAGPGQSGESAWLFAAFNPWNVYGLTMGAVWPAVLPVGVTLLALRGAWLAARVPTRTAFAPWVLWVVYGTLRMAAHGAADLHAEVTVARWELYRYILPFTPVVMLLGVLGALDEGMWEALHELGKDVPLGARWLVAVTLAFPWPWMAHLMHTGPDGAPEWPDGLHPVAEADSMTEVRALIQRSERQPACALLVPGWTWRGEPDPARFEWAVLVPGERGLRWTAAHLPGSTPPSEVLRQMAPEAPCAAVWRSMDCAQPKSPGCDWVSALVPAGDLDMHHVPMDHPTHGGVWPATYTVGFYGIPGVPTDAPP